MKAGDTAFAAYADVVIYGEKGAGQSTKGKKPQNQLIWGDWMKIISTQGNWLDVVGRGSRGWIHKTKAQPNRILEVNFVDVGQGDGCHIVTPDDKAIIIDAGQEDNMYRFLKWRYGNFEKPFAFHAAVITHPDSDHYKGFKKLFKKEKISFTHVLHNGIVERVASSSLSELGKSAKDRANKKRYLTDIVTDEVRLAKIVNSSKLAGRKVYPNLLKSALNSGRVKSIKWLPWDPKGSFLPGCEPDPKDDSKAVFAVLGPVPEPDQNGKPRLRVFKSSKGKTKNGHSVILRLQIGQVSMLLGGDLNSPAENYLLEHFTGLSMPVKTAVQERAMVDAAREVFGVDIAKACHHGSGDFSETFLQSVDAVATVISSGDNESHGHPRPDALGALGKYGRGERPLIFSTELARSTKEGIKEPNRIRAEMKADLKILEEDEEASAAEKNQAMKRVDRFFDQLGRSIARYGMITARTDGSKVLMAQKLEKPRGKASKWDLHRLEPDASGRMTYLSKH